MHLYKTRLKCLLRNRSLVFWTLLFPIVLSVFFSLAFTNITKGDSFETINVSIVEGDNQDDFIEFLTHLEFNENTKMFNVSVDPKEEASSLLEQNKITGFIEYTNVTEIKLTLKASGINQTILKTVLDEYIQSSSTISQIIVISQGTVTVDEILADIGEYKEFIQEKDNGTNTPNLALIYYYALLGMALMYGGIWGTNEIINLQANLSTKGMRVTISPTKRMKLLLANMLSAFTIHILEIMIFLLFVTQILGVSFGSNTLLIILLCVLGSFTGISFGAFIGISLKKSQEGLKTGITSLIGVIGGFLSGMMFANVKYWVQANAPFLQYINPVNVMSDGLYSLYYFETKDRYILNMIILGIMSVVFVIGTYINFRRDSYESI